MEDLTEMVFNTPPSQVSTFEYIYTRKNLASTRCVCNRLVSSLSTSCVNVIGSLSSCYKIVTHNVLTSC